MTELVGEKKSVVIENFIMIPLRRVDFVFDGNHKRTCGWVCSIF